MSLIMIEECFYGFFGSCDLMSRQTSDGTSPARALLGFLSHLIRIARRLNDINRILLETSSKEKPAMHRSCPSSPHYNITDHSRRSASLSLSPSSTNVLTSNPSSTVLPSTSTTPPSSRLKSRKPIHNLHLISLYSPPPQPQTTAGTTREEENSPS